ncbi:MAG: exonuclease V subunit gamma [Myxococcales bacterium]|nr:exonuclease V subunit gamma [Myxococcales bacterium]
MPRRRRKKRALRGSSSPCNLLGLAFAAPGAKSYHARRAADKEGVPGHALVAQFDAPPRALQAQRGPSPEVIVPLLLYRSRRAESLVEALARQLAANWPTDPFARVAIVVGSHAMARWLRHELATRHGIAAHLDFPFPHQALDGAVRWLLDPARDGDAPFWDAAPHGADDPWRPDALAFRVVAQLRRSLAAPGFEAVAAYLRAGGGAAADADHPVAARELQFAREVAGVLDRLLHERWQDAVAWMQSPAAAPEPHRWLASLLAELAHDIDRAGASEGSQSPAHTVDALRRRTKTATRRHLFVFGLSTLGCGDLDRLGLVAHAVHVHFFLLAPSDVWWQDVRTRHEARRDLARARTPLQRQEVEGQLASQNPLLAGLGGPSRDIQAWLEEVGYEGDALAPPPAVGDSTLARLQDWIAAAAPLPAPGEPAPLADVVGDRTVAAHAAFGALRQVEALRDELLARFAADPLLEPRDVVVMTPDIETFAPLVAAVFARQGQARRGNDVSAPVGGEEPTPVPAIPVAVADVGLRRTNAVAEVLLQVLALVGERFTITRLLDLIALEPVALRFGFKSDDLGTVRELARAAGLRWGVDAADRAAVDQPALDQNTLRFALERLAMGVLLPDPEGSLAVVEGTPMPIVPEPVRTTDRAALMGRFTVAARTLAALRSALAPSRSGAQWRDALVAALDDVAQTPDSVGWLRSTVVAELDALREAATANPCPLTPAAVLRWLQGRFDVAHGGDRPVGGAITVCALEPMRSVPFRVVALLGLDDGVFPRPDRPAAWDPFAERSRSGERDRRAIDRHLVLEAILSARECLLLFWSGSDVRTGKSLPAAVVVEELLEALGRLAGVQRSTLVCRHPLQPWSPQAFNGAPLRSFDAALCEAARSLAGTTTAGRDPAHAALGNARASDLPLERSPRRTLTVAELAKGLVAPLNLLLGDRLGIAAAAVIADLEDREPLTLDALDDWTQRDRLLTALADAASRGVQGAELVGPALAYAAGRGELPLQTGGRLVLEDALESAQRVLSATRRTAGESVVAPVLALTMPDGTVIEAGSPTTRDQGGRLLFQWTTPSKNPNSTMQLRAWLTLLVARGADVPVDGSHVVGCGEREGVVWLAPPATPSDALAVLVDLVHIWRLARCRPLPLFEGTSRALADVLLRYGGPPLLGKGRTKAAAAVANAWDDGERPDAADPAVRDMFGTFDVVDALDDSDSDGLVGLAARVWLPLARAAVAGAGLRGAWTRADEGP